MAHFRGWLISRVVDLSIRATPLLALVGSPKVQAKPIIFSTYSIIKMAVDTASPPLNNSFDRDRKKW